MRFTVVTLALLNLAPLALAACQAANIVTACLGSTKPQLDNCTPNDWTCLCARSQDVLTCYNNCPDDDRRFGAQQTVTSYCNAAKAQSAASSAAAPTATGTGTGTATKKAAATETGMTESSSTMVSVPSGSASGTASATGTGAASATEGAATVNRVNGGLVAAIMVGASILL